MEEWLTSYEAAHLSGYNPDYIRQLIRTKKVLDRKWGQSWQVNHKALKDYLAKSEKQGQRRGQNQNRIPNDASRRRNYTGEKRQLFEMLQ